MVIVVFMGGLTGVAVAQPVPAPVPLLDQARPVAWWFVFKFNTAAFPGCGPDAVRACPFGGTVQEYEGRFSQQFVYASSANPSLTKGGGCVGTTSTDPVGATFGQVYNGMYYYVIWNDQFYDDPPIAGCDKECGEPWGHAKGMVAWNEAGEGVVMQVSTPSWPAAGSHAHPRTTDGNTLGCIQDDNVEVSQHFFAVQLTGEDLPKLLRALHNASVVTDPGNPQIVRNGGPGEVQALVQTLGQRSDSTTFIKVTLSSGVEVLSKPSQLHVPPWQMVSAALGGTPLRTATWWAAPHIPSTTNTTMIGCWSEGLGTPAAVEIATSGQWEGQRFRLTGGEGPDHNHAKLGVSTLAGAPYIIFGDMNQQGALSPGDGDPHPGQACARSQNGRGGIFYIVHNATLWDGGTTLLHGDTAPETVPTW
jgi:hypothetical protein